MQNLKWSINLLIWNDLTTHVKSWYLIKYVTWYITERKRVQSMLAYFQKHFLGFDFMNNEKSPLKLVHVNECSQLNELFSNNQYFIWLLLGIMLLLFGFFFTWNLHKKRFLTLKFKIIKIIWDLMKYKYFWFLFLVISIIFFNEKSD